MKINFFSTTLNKSINKKIIKLFKNKFISSGSVSDRFEKKFSKLFNLKYCTAVNSGTSALHLALRCGNIGKGDEVIIPPQTFIATGLAVKYTGAKPVFADIQKNTGNICPKSILNKISKKTKAIIAVHWGGYPCDMIEIKKIVKKYNLILIEDAAHALGAKYKKLEIGNISDFTCFSFQAKKQLTTGDGGMLICKKKKDHNTAQKLKWFDINRKSNLNFQGERQYDISDVGYKYHLNDIASTIGIENLKIIKNKIRYINYIAKTYDENFKDLKEIKILDKKKDRSSTNWLYTVLVRNRSKFYNYMTQNNIPVSLVHRRIDRYKVFGGKTKNLKNQEYFDNNHICLPIHEQLSKVQIDKIVEKVKSFSY
tara:strand:+ start:1166 stop:2269 length:1104 start_codon:yes stop_codon:yes gene_type:complete